MNEEEIKKSQEEVFKILIQGGYNITTLTEANTRKKDRSEYLIEKISNEKLQIKEIIRLLKDYLNEFDEELNFKYNINYYKNLIREEKLKRIL
ncbi:hypothetical protein M0Q97_11300 [Candidatus Dojkabacteria bacterium]|jgi:hypothetical protein|nr:hypothetical protein [Candidatus Dojkabacteria bacterium]